MVLFAGIMGSVGDLVAKANKVKADWQQRMDGLKQFMTYRSTSICSGQFLPSSQLFEGCELAFLKDLVARLEPMEFGPGDVMRPEETE
ncbi:hypothetical protein OSTOST_24889 [Ostertagia ostertagi]